MAAKVDVVVTSAFLGPSEIEGLFDVVGVADDRVTVDTQYYYRHLQHLRKEASPFAQVLEESRLNCRQDRQLTLSAVVAQIHRFVAVA